VCPSGVSPESIAAVFLKSPQACSAGATGGTVNCNSVPFATNNGLTFSSDPGSKTLNKSHYMLMAGYPVFDAGTGVPGQFEGAFMYNKQNTLVGIPDGTSNTIFAAEFSNSNVDFGAGNSLTGPCSGTFASGPLYTYWAPRTEPNSAYIHYKFSSNHTGMFNVVMGDGSVRGLRNNIDYTTWVVLGGKGDGWLVKND